MPFNIRIGGTEIPVGLGIITITLFMLAGINVVTKQIATISGIEFHHRFFHDVRPHGTLQPTGAGWPPAS